MKRILVSTILRGAKLEESGKLYIYDWETKSVVKEFGMTSLNARMCTQPYGGSRGHRGACIDEKRKLIYVASADTITVLDYDFTMLYTIEHPLFCNLHEIKLYGDYLYIASCGNDAILRWKIPEDADAGLAIEIVWSKDPLLNYANYNNMDRYGDWRPNSLCHHDDKDYVIFAVESKICRIDGDEGVGALTELIGPDRAQTPHNVMFNGNNMYYNSSVDSVLYKLDKDTLEVVDSYNDASPVTFGENTRYSRWGWLRGMDIVGDKLLVGSSPYGRVFMMDISTPGKMGEPEAAHMSRNDGEPVSSAVFFKEDWQ